MNYRTLGNEGGYALVLSIFMLGILMVAGVLISNTSVTDLGTVRNTVVYTQNAAAAESAAMTAIQLLENETDPAQLDTQDAGHLSWIIPADADENISPYNSKWVSITPMSSLTTRAQKEGASIKYIVKGWNSTKGASLGAYSEMLRESVVKGVYYSAKDGVYSVEVGFKKRF